MLRAGRRWLSVYGGKLSGELVEHTPTGFPEWAVEKYQDNIALVQGEREISYGELLG